MQLLLRRRRTSCAQAAADDDRGHDLGGGERIVQRLAEGVARAIRVAHECEQQRLAVGSRVPSGLLFS
eukprot:4036381-Prymnesium_polylepis.1